MGRGKGSRKKERVFLSLSFSLPITPHAPVPHASCDMKMTGDESALVPDK